MKKILLLLAVIPIFASAQIVVETKKTDYYGWRIQAGDTMLLNRDNGQDGYSSIKKGRQILSQDYNEALVVGKIKKFTHNNGDKEVVLVLTNGYTIDMDKAVKASEIQMPIDFIPSKVDAEFSDGYKASNGITYKVGDLVEMGQGSDVNGKFKYLKLGGWGSVLTAMQTPSANQQVGGVYNGTKVIIKSINYERNKRRDYTKVWMSVGGGNITNYLLDIESAIATCEVVPCGKSINKPTISPADELLKLKQLLDAGAISKDEFEQQKEKLLKYY